MSGDMASRFAGSIECGIKASLVRFLAELKENEATQREALEPWQLEDNLLSKDALNFKQSWGAQENASIVRMKHQAKRPRVLHESKLLEQIAECEIALAALATWRNR